VLRVVVKGKGREKSEQDEVGGMNGVSQMDKVSGRDA
jgi:hypothetical protein